jgi:hypothetical protein
MASEPTIPVLMPAYNTGRYVAEAVESILTQTYTDFEFLIFDYAQIASDQACDRRRIARRFQPTAPYCQWNNRSSRHDLAIRYGWSGFMRGDRWMALHYGLRSVRLKPWQSDGWRLLACAVLKTPPKGKAPAEPDTIWVK